MSDTLNFERLISDPRILSVLFIIVFVISVVASIAYIYHWRKYGLHIKSIAFATTFYLVVLVSLLVFSAILLSVNLF